MLFQNAREFPAYKALDVGEEFGLVALEGVVVEEEFLFGAAEAEGPRPPLVHAHQNRANAVNARVGAKPAATHHARREILQTGRQVRHVRSQAREESVPIVPAGEEVIVEDVNQDAGNPAPLFVDPGAAAFDGRMGVGVAIQFAVQLHARAEVSAGHRVQASLHEIAEEIAEAEQSRVRQNQQVPQVIHYLLV